MSRLYYKLDIIYLYVNNIKSLEAAFKILFHCGKPSEQQDALVGFILKQPRYFHTLGAFLVTLKIKSLTILKYPDHVKSKYSLGFHRRTRRNQLQQNATNLTRPQLRFLYIRLALITCYLLDINLALYSLLLLWKVKFN